MTQGIIVSALAIPVIAALFWNAWRLFSPRADTLRRMLKSRGGYPYKNLDTLEWLDEFERGMWVNRSTAATYVWLVASIPTLLIAWACQR